MAGAPTRTVVPNAAFLIKERLEFVFFMLEIDGFFDT